MAEIKWDRKKLQRLKEAYEAFGGAKHDVFEFEGHKFVKQYAKYLIEYLETELRSDSDV